MGRTRVCGEELLELLDERALHHPFGFERKLDGAKLLVAEDRPGSVARIAGVLAEERINLATMRVTRKERGGDAFMVIELDDAPSADATSRIGALEWVRWVRALQKVGA